MHRESAPKCGLHPGRAEMLWYSGPPPRYLRSMHNDALQTPTEVLDAGTCWDLLRGVSVGHLAVLVDGYPEVFPVNYKVDQQSVVFRTGEGAKLRAAGGPLAVLT